MRGASPEPARAQFARAVPSALQSIWVARALPYSTARGAVPALDDAGLMSRIRVANPSRQSELLSPVRRLLMQVRPRTGTRGDALG